MADNVSITAGSGTTISTEEVTTLNGGAVSAQQVQRVASAIRTADGAAIDLPGDATNGLDVDVTRLPALAAGTNNIGDVDILSIAAGDNNIGNVDIASSLPAGTNAIGKLAANSGVDIGDVDVTSISAGENHLGEVGGKTVVKDVTLSLDTSQYASGDVLAATQQIDAFFRKTDGTGVIQSIQVIDISDQKAAFDLYFFTANQSLGTENAAPDIDDTEVLDILGPISVATTDYKDLGANSVALIKNIGLPVKAVSGTDDLYVGAINGTGTPTYSASGITLRIGVLLD